MKSKSVSTLISVVNRLARAHRAIAVAAVLGAVTLVSVPSVQAQGTKIGFVSTERILRDSKPAKAAQAKIDGFMLTGGLNSVRDDSGDTSLRDQTFSQQ